MFFFNYSENILIDYDNLGNGLFINKNLTMNNRNFIAYEGYLAELAINSEFYCELPTPDNYADYMDSKRCTIEDVMEFLGISK